ncbi:MAG: hypothetical protein MK105_17790 [Crocinitomicaceae bacterium]|nr:hypothetical protein [Crocinitomicaceae bacterium]
MSKVIRTAKVTIAPFSSRIKSVPSKFLRRNLHLMNRVLNKNQILTTLIQTGKTRVRAARCLDKMEITITIIRLKDTFDPSEDSDW